MLAFNEDKSPLGREVRCMCVLHCVCLHVWAGSRIRQTCASTVLYCMQHRALLHAAPCFIACSTVLYCMQHRALLHAAQCFIACSTVLYCMQHCALLHAALCFIACSTVLYCMQHSALLHAAQCPVRACLLVVRWCVHTDYIHGTPARSFQLIFKFLNDDRLIVRQVQKEVSLLWCF